MSIFFPENSTNIQRIQYKVHLKQMHIIFKSNKNVKYIYSNVPHQKYRQLIKAESVGRYINQNIKSSHQFKKQQLLLG